MSEHTDLPILDDLPANGEFAPALGELTLTSEEIAEGNALGHAIYLSAGEAR